MPTSIHRPTRNQRKLLLFFLKCIIMLIVMSLFLFLVGFAAIILLHLLFLSHTFNLRPSTATSTEPPPKLLPDVVYIAANFPTKSDCAICLDSFEEGDVCTNLPVCKHLFHAVCLDRWIWKKPSCPVCRTPVNLDPKGLPGSRIGASGGDLRWKRLWTVDSEQGTSSSIEYEEGTSSWRENTKESMKAIRVQKTRSNEEKEFGVKELSRKTKSEFWTAHFRRKKQNA